MWVIRGKYLNTPTEDIDFFETRKEALAMIKEYRLCFGAGWIMRIIWRKGE